MIQINRGITVNVDVRVKNIIYVKQNHIWNPSKCSCENGKYLASIMNDSAIMCDEVIKSYDKKAKTSFNKFQQILTKKKYTKL